MVMILIPEIFMNLFELKNYFDSKISSMPLDDEYDITLDSGHIFLKMALRYATQCSEPVIGEYRLENRGIKYDGYYVDEDEKEFHLLSLVYFENLDNINEYIVNNSVEKALESAKNFVKSAYMQKSSVSAESEIGEHIQEMIEDVNSCYSICIDIFSNVNFSTANLPSTTSIGKYTCKIGYYCADQIVDSIESDETKNLLVEFKKNYGQPLQAMKIARNDDFDVYLTYISGETLSRVYDDHKSRLMDGNVRAYLKRTQKTNKGISETIRLCPMDFVAYNNGISAVAAADNSDIRPLGENVFLIYSLDRFQIVNGGQTTVTLYLCSKDGRDLSDVVVPIKLTVLKKQDLNADIVSNIAVYANTQTAISKSDLASNKPFYKSLEALARQTPCYRTSQHSIEDAYYWFFERANGLYNTRRRIIWNGSNTFNRQFPEKNKFSKKLLAKAINAISQLPYVVCEGNEKSFQKFDNAIELNYVMPNAKYYKNAIATLIIWREADKIIGKKKLPIKAAVLPYTIALISYKFDQRIDLDTIWKNQTLDRGFKSLIDSVSDTISNYFKSIIEEQPNTLMWGRKKECWEAVKQLKYGGVFEEISRTSERIDFFPQNPASVFINNTGNFNSIALWQNLKTWSEGKPFMTQSDMKIIDNIINTITLSRFVTLPVVKKQGSAIFSKAVQNGFLYM